MTTLLKIRKEHRIKRSQIAHWTQLNYTTLWYWETGKKPYPHYAELLYRAYINQFRGQGDDADARPTAS